MEDQNKTATQALCYHCGEDLPKVKYQAEDKDFCCAGCMAVFKILSANNLCNYYVYNNNPGRQFKNESHLEYLDEPKIIDQLLDYKHESSSIITFYIPAIHCSSCIWLLEHLYKINPAIFSSRIDFLKKQVTISFNHNEISLRQLVQTLNQIGYEPLISLQDVVQEHSGSADKALILKIAVAGFLMGNVMLFSFPEYFGLSGFEKQFQSLFGWLNLTFSIPAAFYCGRDYFTSAITSLKHRHINLDTPLALIIAILFLRTAFEVVFGTGPGFADTLTGLVFLLLMGKWLKQRTYHHISFDRDYRSYFPIAVTTLLNGKEKPVAINEIKIGDRLWIRSGELVPADAILMKGEAWMDMSFVTGESDPVHKVLGEIIYAGGRQTSEAIELEVIKPVSQSYLTGLWNNDNYKNNSEKQNFNDSIAKYFSLGVFLIAFAATGYWLLQNDSHKAWSAFTAVIIVACPCVLALSTPFTLSAILSVFDKKGFYVKNTDAVEELAKCDTLIFDKTGTLTSNENAEINFNGSLTSEEKIIVASLLRNSIHSLSRHIIKALNVDRFYSLSDYKEVIGKGLTAKINGQSIYAGHLSMLPIQVASAGESGVHIVIDHVYKGCFDIRQQWRLGLEQMILKLSRFNLQVLSGDTDKDRWMLDTIFTKNTTISFRQSPHQKLNAVLQLQQQGNKVMMLGDGLNDAGALKQSSFGVAITDNINSFSPGCDAILKGSALNFLPDFIQLSKDGLKIIKTSFAIAIVYNCIGIYFAVQGTLYPLVAAVLMPISTVTIISFTTMATRWFAGKNKLI
ncbi:heavy metal translocating P-type ATPase metal-binding domain-containing protein [Pedobacter sp. ISL-68]|uniref:heavy metal translocating P-type ATPase n=1 Tax=unclassified Pedobacter TaxID=2628915 RepID=UPI001BE60102|nr:MULTISPECIES: heavy metal translocating P-type ATPase metal-binding domain-containing protein [unclassified Pedobacter]MBT2563008.1 heavy metal translocating P-type ATPase metal-binding domain-containing protein [Pedobacter sp. ISL-64]MBT2593012.1 heavy metal translocating P-type ATPase metal-binding domain-containing protein [Pedobacter sp. ISL-68]